MERRRNATERGHAEGVRAVEYINEFGGRYRVMREVGGCQYQVWQKGRNGENWLPFSTPKGSYAEAQAWLDELAERSEMRIFRGVMKC